MPEHEKLLKNNRFQVYIEEKKLSFAKISGLNAEMEKELYSQGGANSAPLGMFTPRTQSGKLRMERGVQAREHIISSLRPGTYIPYIEIIVMGEDGKPAWGYYLEDAFVTKWEVQDLDAMEGRILVDSFELDYLMIYKEYLR